MKKVLWCVTAVVAALPILAQASCETVKADISQKIVANGLPESAFTLEIVPNDQANQTAGQVVGHCENDSQKIVYQKNGGDDARVPANAGSAQDAPSP